MWNTILFCLILATPMMVIAEDSLKAENFKFEIPALPQPTKEEIGNDPSLIASWLKSSNDFEIAKDWSKEYSMIVGFRNFSDSAEYIVAEGTALNSTQRELDFVFRMNREMLMNFDRQPGERLYVSDDYNLGFQHAKWLVENQRVLTRLSKFEEIIFPAFRVKIVMNGEDVFLIPSLYYCEVCKQWERTWRNEGGIIKK